MDIRPDKTHKAQSVRKRARTRENKAAAIKSPLCSRALFPRTFRFQSEQKTQERALYFVPKPQNSGSCTAGVCLCCSRGDVRQRDDDTGDPAGSPGPGNGRVRRVRFLLHRADDEVRES